MHRVAARCSGSTDGRIADTFKKRLSIDLGPDQRFVIIGHFCGLVGRYIAPQGDNLTLAKIERKEGHPIGNIGKNLNGYVLILDLLNLNFRKVKYNKIKSF